MDQPENFIPLPPDFRLMEEAGNVDLSYIDEEEEKEEEKVEEINLDDIVSVSDSECPDLSDMDIDDRASSEEENSDDEDLQW